MSSEPNSAVDICNLALYLIGQGRKISSITDYSDNTSATMASWYDITRQQMLREFIWNFSKGRKILARLTEAPEFDYPDAYQLPDDFVRLISIGEKGYEIGDYDIQGKTIYCDNGGATSLQLRYVKNIEDVSLFDATFKICLAQRLALNTAFSFELKNAAVERLNAQYTLDIRAAVGVDGQEKPVRYVTGSRSMSARRYQSAGYNPGSSYL